MEKPRCPRCNDYLDYDPNRKVWKCLWIGCGFEKKVVKEEGNPVLLSIFGKKEEIE